MTELNNLFPIRIDCQANFFISVHLLLAAIR
jgi:hypothetical protein